MMRRVVFNQKGGVGKSSISVNLAAVAAAKGKKVLLVDLDTQCNSTHYLLGRESGINSTIADFFNAQLSFRLRRGPKGLTEDVHETPFENLWVIPSSHELGEIQSKLESKFKIYKLREALRALEHQYDIIYIDTPPALNFYSLSALIAANRCLVPFDCDDFSRQALYSVIDNVEETREDHNQELIIEGIVVNQFMPRALLPTRVVDELIEEGLPVLQSKLSSSIKMKESHDACDPLITFSPGHKLTQQFIALHQELDSHT